MINLHHIDCLEFMRGLPDKAYDLVIVDPPYNIASTQKRGVWSRIDKTGKMNEWNNKPPSTDYFRELFRISSGQIIWGANNYNGLPPTEYFCIWNKKQSVDNFASAEYAWVSPSLRMPAKVFEYGIHLHNSNIYRIHPTQKPVALYKWLLKNYAKPGDRILDTHGGSMSIAIACYDLGFDLDLCEIDADYFASGKERLNDHICKYAPAIEIPIDSKGIIKLF